MSDILLCFCALQTLTELNLHCNQIGDEGAQHLAVALESNKVRQTRSCLISHIRLSSLLFRHSRDLISRRIKSDIKVLDIWLMH